MADVLVQRGRNDIASTGGTDTGFTSVSALTAAFEYNGNNFPTHGGTTTGNDEADDMSGYIELTGTGTLTFSRTATGLRNGRFDWEIVEYTGSGGDNEFIVRSRNTLTLTGGSQTASLDTTPTNIDNCVPFITGVLSTQTSNSGDDLRAIAYINDSGTLVVERASTAGTTTVQVVVVEFTGANWSVYHGTTTSSADTGSITCNTDSDGAGGTTMNITDWSTAFIEGSFTSTDQGLDSIACIYDEGSSSQVDWTFNSGNTTSHKHFVHVVQHDELSVTRYTPTGSAAGDTNVDITSAGLTDISEAMIIGTCQGSGGGTAYARNWRNYSLTSTTNARHYCSRSGNTINHNIQVIDFAGITADGGSTSPIAGDTTVTFSESATLSGTGELQGATSIGFGGNVTLTGRGALHPNGVITFSESATLSGFMIKSVWGGSSIGPHVLPIKNYIFTVPGGALQAEATVAFGESVVLSGRGELQASATVAFSENATLTASGALAAATSVNFSETATLMARGSLVAAESVDFSDSATLSGRGSLQASTSIDFTATGALVQTGLVGIASVDFSESATLSARGALQGSTSIAFGESVTLNGSGALQAATSIAFSETANLTAAAGKSDWGGVDLAPTVLPIGRYTFTAPVTGLRGSTDITFSDNVSLTATGELQGSTSIDLFSFAVYLTGRGRLQASTSIDFTASGTLEQPGDIAGSTSIDFSESATLSGRGSLQASVSIDFSASGTLQLPPGGMQAATSLDFTESANLTARGALQASTSIDFSASGFMAGPTPVVKKKKGGRVKKRYVVEVDGEFFEVRDIAAAQAFLQQVREAASEAAERDVTTETPKAPAIRIRTLRGAPTRSKVLQKAVTQTQRTVRQAYQKQAEKNRRDREINLEIATLMQKKIQREEEDQILLLLSL